MYRSKILSRVSLKRTLLTGTLLATSTFLTHSALAQKGVILNPQTGWAVKNVREDAARGEGYCAIARKFQKHAILTFAKNERAEASVALDFQKPIFKSGGALSVSLDPGAGEERSYEVRPISETAFVVKLGQDEAFFGAIEKTGYLRIVVDKEIYNFNLSDIEKGQGQLEACLGAPIKSAAAEPAPEDMGAELNRVEPSAGHPAVTARLDVLQAENDILRRRLADQAAAPVRAPEDVSTIKALQSDVERLQDARGQLAESTRTVEKLKATIERLKEDNQNLKLLVHSERSDHGEEVGQLVQKLQQENRLFGARINELKDMSSEVEKLRTQISKLESDNQMLRMDMQQNAADNNERLANLIRENEDYKKILEGQERELQEMSEMRVELYELQQKNNELSFKLEEQREYKQSLQDNSLDAQRKMSAVMEQNTRLKELVSHNSHAQKIMQQLERQIQLIEGEKDALEDSLNIAENENVKKAEQINLLNRQLSAVEAEANLLKKTAMSNRAEASEQTTGMRTQMGELQATLVDLRGEIDHKDTIIDSLNKQIEMMDAVHGHNTKLMSKLEATEGEFESLAAVRETNLRKMEEQQKIIDRMQDIIDRFEGEVQRKDIQLMKLSQNAADLDRLRAQQNMLEEKLVGAQRQRTENTSLKSDLDRLELENRKLKQQLEIAVLGADEETQKMLSAFDMQDSRLNSSLEMQKLRHEQDHVYDDLSKMNSGARVTAPGEGDDLSALRSQLDRLMAESRVLKAEAQTGNAAKDVNVWDDLAKIEPSAGPIDITEDSESSAVTPGELDTLRVENKEIMQDLDRMRAQIKSYEEKIHELPEVKPQDPAREHRADAAILEHRISALSGRSHAMPSGFHLASAEAPVQPPAEKVMDEVLERVQEEAKDVPARVMDITDRSEALAPEVYTPPALSEAQRMELEMARQLAKKKGQAEPNTVKQTAVEPLMNKGSDGVSQDLDTARVEEEILQAPVQNVIEQTDKNGFYKPAFSVQNILAGARLVSVEQVKPLQAASNAQRVIYQWNTQSIAGSAEQKALRSEAEFEKYVYEYMERTEKRCEGDFAVVPNDTKQIDAMRIDSYDIACVGDNTDSSASLLFFNKDGTFAIIAHEAPVEKMHIAIHIRDQLVKEISGQVS